MKRAAALPAHFALAIAAVNGAHHLARHEAHDLLWLCNLACPLMAAGCYARAPLAVAVAALWLVFGTPLWLLDLVTGGEIFAAAFLTHFGGLAVGALSLRELGYRRGAWLWASLGGAAVVGAARLLTAPRYNVNLAHAVWPGWQRWFPHHFAYLALLFATACLTFFAVERVALKLLFPPSLEQAPT